MKLLTTSSIAIGSMPANGSSSRRNFGELAKALAISVLLLSPPDNNLPFVFENHQGKIDLLSFLLF